MRDERNIERKKESQIGRREGGEEGDRGKSSWGKASLHQGSLTEGKGSVQLTSLY